jgi:hypothetical protein
MEQWYDVLAIGARPDDVEVFMGGTAAKLARKGVKLLLVDPCDGEPMPPPRSLCAYLSPPFPNGYSHRDRAP